MNRSLRDCQHDLLEYALTDEQIRNLKLEIDNCWTNASDEEKEEFLCSGAGDALGMALEYMN